MEISIDSPQQKFTEHLNLESNNRILFSGKFGTGKSYFLKKYFESHKDKYNLFWVSPVNYVVGANKDIFEWIKVDIAKELLFKTDFSEGSEGLPDNLIAQTFLFQNAGSLFTKLLKVLANKAAKKATGIDFIKDFEREIAQYEQFKEKTRTEMQSVYKNLEEIVNNSLQVKGSIFEDDLTTQLLRSCIKTLSEQTRRESVLIIDDFDRLDPEHIFRILNILSVHNDHFDSNKFGFDKVIVVCDLNNIEGLYHHRYGFGTDFNGYIEKFHSYEPFEFSIKLAVINYCQRFELIAGLDINSQRVMNLLLAQFVEHKMITVRNLTKTKYSEQIISSLNLNTRFYQVGTDHTKQHFTDSVLYQIDYNSFPFLKVIYLLGLIFGSIENLKKSLNKLVKKPQINIDTSYFNDILESMALLNHVCSHDINTKFYILLQNEPSQQYPELIFANQKYTIVLPWSRNNKYDGKDNYFKNCQLKMVQNFSINSELIITDRLVYETILTIIDNAQKNSIFKDEYLY